MKRAFFIFALFLPIALVSCSSREGESTAVNFQNKPAAGQSINTKGNNQTQKPRKPAAEDRVNGIIYQLVENQINRSGTPGIECYSFSFLRFLNGGYVLPDGRENRLLKLRGAATSKVKSRKRNGYYYISTLMNPVKKQFHIKTFDWDVDGQALWSAKFIGTESVQLAGGSGNAFPGGLAVSPENKFLVYPLTQKNAPNNSKMVVFNKFNPFISDSSLAIVNLTTGKKKTVLVDNYNRRLFVSFGQFSADGSAFYTLERKGNSFRFVRIDLASGKVAVFRDIFPDFQWDSLNWDAFFPRSGDFAYASFTISPDEKRLIATKDVYASKKSISCTCDAFHNLWVFGLRDNFCKLYKHQPGYVSSTSWKADASSFAFSMVGQGGCYPEYLHSSIVTFDTNGRRLTTLVTELHSKITTIGWSPDMRVIAYDVYSADFVGRLKLVNVATKKVSEIITTQKLGYEVDHEHPVTILFSDWVDEK